MSEYLNKKLYFADEYEALCGFLSSSFRNKNRSEKNYAYDFNKFREFIGISIFDVNADLCRQFLDSTEKVYLKKQAPTTVERIYSQLHRLYEYLANCGKVSKNPFYEVKKPTVPRERTKNMVLSFEEANKLFAAAQKLNLRDRTILLMLFTTGLKVKDFVSLNWNQLIYDINNELGFYIKRPNGMYYNKLHPDVSVILLQYRQSLGKGAKIEPNESSPIFINAKGERISQNWVRLVIKDACEIASIEHKSPSNLRNSIGTFMLAFGASPEEVSQVLGYSDTFLTSRLPIVLPPRSDYMYLNVKGVAGRLQEVDNE